MTRINQRPIRSFKNVSKEEIMIAVKKMCDELHCYGSGSDYSIYTTLFELHDKLNHKGDTNENLPILR